MTGRLGLIRGWLNGEGEGGGFVFVEYSGIKQNPNKFDCPFIDLPEESLYGYHCTWCSVIFTKTNL